MANTNVASTSNTVKGTLHSIGDAAARVSDKVSEIGEAASAMAQNAEKAVDAKRAPIAKGLDSAAATLHSGAESLENTATYIRKNKVRSMLGDAHGLIKSYPTAAVIGAVVVGFAAGRMLRRG